MEVGQSSGSNKPPLDLEVWAKLVPLDSRFPEFEIRLNETVVCSDITSNSGKHVWCQITRNSDLCSAKIKNKSSSVILVDGVLVNNGDAVSIKCGSEIVPGSLGKGHLKYKFEVMPVDNGVERKLEISTDVENAKCSICLNVWHDVVTAAPCLHNFCNGCFSEWIRRSQKKSTGTVCPQCRGVVQFVGRNHFLHNIEEEILKSDASLRRPKEELDVLDSYSCIKSNLVLTNGKLNSRKRTRSPVYSESDDSYQESEEPEHSCPQCAAEFNNFYCNLNTVHLQCHSCGGMMPSRSDSGTPQHCLGCDRAFCGAYWHAQRIPDAQIFHPICSRDTFVPISERRLSAIPISVHEGNQFEQEITLKCMQHTGKTVQDVITLYSTKLTNREIDITRLPLKHPDLINTNTHLCNECFEKYVSYLLYWYRVTLPVLLTPKDLPKREDCWYGYGCRTQHHSVDHARKRNHVCRPSRGSHF
ncbi:hypothetical protein V2J09_001153 [Rumex salicifolius]